MTVEERHIANAELAAELYLNSLDASQSTKDWHYALREARKQVSDLLRASDYLRDIEQALMESGSHVRACRSMLAPPISQDQFKIVCREWPKGSEKTGTALDADTAAVVSEAIRERLDYNVCRWVRGGGSPDREEVMMLLRIASSVLAMQQFATARRNRLSFEQEFEATQLLLNAGWKRLPSRLIDTRGTVRARHFMHKTRFATNTTTPQEVDIACGLQGSYVLAMECKVTNDTTNSVKRVNDVLKKATAWREHWGSFVKTAALLQGVISPRDVQRLTDAGVEVFWSHNLGEFGDWLETRA